MKTIQIQVPKELAQQLEIYQNELPHILELGLRLIMIEKANQASLPSLMAIDLWQWLDKPVTGQCTRAEIDTLLQLERENWK
jgi:hypothetical protein